jgi:hypothetical protein
VPKFNFDNLSPKDFEEVVRDLLQAEWDVPLEAFREGRDSGIDLRYAPAHGSTTIVQCKRYGHSGYRKLLNHLRDLERPKIERLNPTRYVVATAVALTPPNKEEIADVLAPYVLSTGDILGADDLEGLLARHAAIERANFKLWLTSTAVLERVLHNAELCQTNFEVDRVYRKLPMFVQSDAFPRARELLDDTRIVIISGSPGIGKTTLAEMLLYAQLEEGYEPVVIRAEIAEGKRLFSPTRKQIFYYDDFLGQTFLGDRVEYLGRNEDAAIVDFMEMVRASEHGRFVLTTREHILSGALQASERLGHSTALQHRCVLTLGDYTVGHRAHILYNHLYFSDLPESYKEQVLERDFFLYIIKHENFSPRLIEWLANGVRLRNVSPEEYRTHIANLLDSPESIWDFAFRNQISDAARHVLLSLYTMGERINAHDLDPAFVVFHRASSNKYNRKCASGDFRRALQELDGGFLNYSAGTISYLNPSIRDYVASVIRRDQELVSDLIDSATRFKQIASLWSLFTRGNTGSGIAIAFLDAQALYDAFLRLLDGPEFRYGRGIAGRVEVHFVDTTVEGRTVFLIQLAELQKDVKAAELATRSVEVLVNGWERRAVSYYFSFNVLEQLMINPWFLANGGQAAYRRVLDCVLGDLVTARASDWIKLVELPNNSVTWTTSDQARLTSGLKNYEERWVYDEEKGCAGLDELNEMKISLEQLAKQKPVSFTSVMRTLDDGITLKEKERGQLAEEEGYSPAMKSPAALAMSDDDVRVMFATLIER